MATNATHAQERRDAQDPWLGPFAEFDRYGEPTGERYSRCRDCGREVMAGREEHVEHDHNCRFAEGQ